jgi:hypothetical protein
MRASSQVLAHATHSICAAVISAVRLARGSVSTLAHSSAQVVT